MPSVRLDQLRVRHLRFIVLLASLGSLAATAEQLAMTASAASMLLKEIEGQFGTRLFRRQGRGMALTEAGQALLPRCQTVLGEVGAMSFALHGSLTPLLRIGAFPHTTTTVLPGIVRKLLGCSPAWRLQIVDGSAEQLMHMLLHGEIDLLLGRVPASVANQGGFEGLAQRVLYESRLSIVASKRHPLADKRSVTWADLCHWPWILPGMQSTTRTAVIDEFLNQGLTPPAPVVESPSYFYSLSVVAHTELLTCCAHSAALHSGHATSILPVGLWSHTTQVAMVWRKSSAQAQRAADQLA